MMTNKRKIESDSKVILLNEKCDELNNTINHYEKIKKKIDNLCSKLSPYRGGPAAIIVAYSNLNLNILEPMTDTPSPLSPPPTPEDDLKESNPTEEKYFGFFAINTSTEGIVLKLKKKLEKQLKRAIKDINHAAELKKEIIESPFKNQIEDNLKIFMLFKRYNDVLPNHPFVPPSVNKFTSRSPK